MIKRKIAGIIPGIFLLLAALVMIFPIITVVIDSADGGIYGIKFFGYREFLVRTPTYINAFVRSALIAAAVTAGSVIVSVPAAYVFAKVRFRGSGVLLYIYIIVMMMPFQVTLLPQYMVSRKYGTYDTPLALILPGIFAPFAVFLLTQMIKSVPDEILDSGRLDTSSAITLITRLVVPMIRPGLICTAVLVFTDEWNMVAEPIVLLESEEQFTMPMLLRIMERIEPVMLASTVIFMVPPLLLFGFFKEEIEEGLGEYRLK